MVDRGAAEQTEDLFLARQVDFAFHRKRLSFDLARTVFSSAGLDRGSTLLLRYLQELSLAGGERVLDLGCGHGTLGIVLQALDPDRRVVFADRDALALRYTARNLHLNGLAPAGGDDEPVVGSLGYDDLDPAEPFDLVVCNVPGKVGDAVIEHLVRDASTVARPGALVGLVVVAPLASQVRQLVAGPEFELLLDKGNKAHQVLVARLSDEHRSAAPELGGFDRGLYDRATVEFHVGDHRWVARTVIGLDEFDSLTPATTLLRAALRDVGPGRTVVLEPGQGHRAVVAAKAGFPPFALVSRDLLALRASDRCLADAGFVDDGRLLPTVAADDDLLVLDHDVELDRQLIASASVVLAHAGRDVHAPWFTAQVTRCLDVWDEIGHEPAAGGGGRHLVLTGRSPLLGRLEAELLDRRAGRVAFKASERGHRVVRFVPKRARPSRRRRS